MLSPGLGQVVVEHPAITSNATSPTDSLLQVPQVGNAANGAAASSSSPSARFNSFPPTRNAEPRSIFGLWDEEANSGTGSGSASAAPGSSAAAPSASASGQLPNTGSEPLWLALTGSAFLLIGAGLRLRTIDPDAY